MKISHSKITASVNTGMSYRNLFKITASVNTGMSYWYLFKHGLGPGTMPKDCHLLKVIEDGWKDYVLLDRMLTTDELNEYEIKEATPSEDLLKEKGYNSLEETYEDVTSDTEVANNKDVDFDGRIVSSTSFDKWYDSLTEEEQWEVDSMADSMDIPFYDEANDAELAQLKDAYESSRTSIEGADDVRMADGTASNYQSFMTWYNSLTNYQKIGVDDYADEHDFPPYEECTFGMLSQIKQQFAEEEDEWAMPKGVYHVAAFGNDYDELQSSFDFKDPKSAITKWIELQKKWPLNVMITGFQEEEENLRKYVTEHPDWYRQLSAKFNCPYDPEYIINECAKPVRPRTGQYANKYTDQCHPFGLG